MNLNLTIYTAIPFFVILFQAISPSTWNVRIIITSLNLIVIAIQILGDLHSK